MKEHNIFEGKLDQSIAKTIGEEIYQWYGSLICLEDNQVPSRQPSTCSVSVVQRSPRCDHNTARHPSTHLGCCVAGGSARIRRMILIYAATCYCCCVKEASNTNQRSAGLSCV